MGQNVFGVLQPSLRVHGHFFCSHFSYPCSKFIFRIICFAANLIRGHSKQPFIYSTSIFGNCLKASNLCLEIPVIARRFSSERCNEKEKQMHAQLRHIKTAHVDPASSHIRKAGSYRVITSTFIFFSASILSV